MEAEGISITGFSGFDRVLFQVITSCTRLALAMLMLTSTNTIEIKSRAIKMLVAYENKLVSSPVVIFPEVIILALIQDMAIIEPCIASIIAGYTMETILSALTKSLYIYMMALSNLFSSKPSLTKDLTTLIPTIFSCTVLLRRS